MDDKLQKVVDSLLDGTHGTLLADDEFAYREAIKYAMTILLDYPHKRKEDQVKLVMETLECSRSHAYKLLSEAMDVFPSIEKVNKAFERMRLTKLCYEFIDQCRVKTETIEGIPTVVSKGNTRDAAQYMKLVMVINGLDMSEDVESGPVTIINILKHNPESIGTHLPANFNLEEFIEKLEGEYENRANTIDIDHREV